MSETLIRSQEMLKAMYGFQATLAKTLSFSEGDLFILNQSKNKQRNWWHVVNSRGQLGFVPSNYVANILVDPVVLISFVTGCLHNLDEDGSELTLDKKELLAQLNEKLEVARNALKPPKKQAPRPPQQDGMGLVNGNAHNMSNNTVTTPNENFSPDAGTPESDQANVDICQQENSEFDDQYDDQQEVEQEEEFANEVAPAVPDNLPSSSSATTELNSREDSSVDVPQHSQLSPIMRGDGLEGAVEGAQLAALLYSMVGRVRDNTGLSHDLSRLAVATIFDTLKEIIPRDRCSSLWTLSSMVSTPGPLVADKTALFESVDACRLRNDLMALVISAQDAQQRAWSLHDDEHVISKHIQEVVSVLTNADNRISRDILNFENYRFVTELVMFYQMETRWGIRELLIQAFNLMCALDREVVKVLCSSILPRELARDMLDNQSEAERLIPSAKLLTTALSMADPLPLSHFEQLDIEFVSFLLEWIELPPLSDVNEHIPDQFLALVCALNLQFNDPDNNLILDSLQMRSHSKTSTEKLLLLLNREDDPVKVLEHQPSAPHSVLKLTLDAFSRRSTAQLFYTNDTKVLLDITVRQLADLSAGDSRRGLYLQLCLGILRHTDYGHCHRQADLLRCFTRIFCEEGEVSRADQQLVRTISNEFPQYFKA